MKPPQLQPLTKHQGLMLRVAALLLALAFVFCAFAWLAGPPLIRSYVATLIGEEIGRKVEFGEVKVHPFSLSAEVHDIVIHEAGQGGAFVKVAALYADVSLASVRRFAPVLDAVRIEAPQVNLVHLGDARFNFSDIVDKLAAKPDTGPTRFSINNIRIEKGSVSYDDRERQSRHALTELDLAVPFLSNLPYAAQIVTQPAISAKLDGAMFKFEADSLPFAPTHRTSLRIDLDGLVLPTYMPFAPSNLRARLQSGLLDARLKVEFEQKPDDQSVMLSGSAALREIKLDDGANVALLQWQSLNVVLDASEPLRGKWRFKDVALDQPIAWVKRSENGVINFLDLFAPRPAATTPAATPATTPAAGAAPVFDLALEQLAITGGKMSWSDAATKSVDGQPALLDLTAIELSLSGFASQGGPAAPLRLSFATAGGARLMLDAAVDVAKLGAEGKLTVEQLKPSAFSPYYASQFAGQLGNTELDAKLTYRLTWPDAGPQLALSDSSLRLRNLQLALPSGTTPVLQAKELRLEGISFDLAARSASASGLTIDAPMVSVTRSADGQIDLMSVLPAGGSGAPQAATTAAAPWRLALNKLAIEQGELGLRDETVAASNNNAPAQIVWRELGVTLEKLAYPMVAGGQAPWPVSLRFKDGREGTVVLNGTLAPMPLAAEVELDARNLDLLAVQPYFADVLNAALTSGALSANGKLRLQTMPGGAAPRIAYTGSVGVLNLRAVDKVNGDDFLRWRSLASPRVDAQINTRSNPLELDLGDVELANFFARVILNANGRLNLADILAGDTTPRGTSLTQATPVASTAQGVDSKTVTAPVPVTPRTGTAPLVRVSGVSLKQGNVNFSDFFVRPNYSTNLTSLAGSVSKVASDQAAPADVVIEGRIDGDAPLKLAGQVNPFATQLFLDLSASAKGIELTRLTPYATKYAGYPITKGKLSVDLKYRIDQGNLEASNKVFLDQLTFGDRVESADATKLPVLLAVALLKNSRGEIDINLPVSGSLSDPQFSIGGVIVRVIVNLLVKAVTAPFSLIAAALGGGDNVDLGYVEFNPGRTVLDANHEKKLDTLAKALSDRPGLKLDIAGRIDPEADRAALLDASVLRLVRAQKRLDMIAQGAGAVAEDVVVPDNEYVKVLERAFKTELAKRPAAVAGPVRPATSSAAPVAAAPTVAQMEQVLRQSARIDENNLKSLADRRALRVKKYLEDHGVASERLFLVSSKLNAEGITDKGLASRADFILRN